MCACLKDTQGTSPAYRAVASDAEDLYGAAGAGGSAGQGCDEVEAVTASPQGLQHEDVPGVAQLRGQEVQDGVVGKGEGTRQLVARRATASATCSHMQIHGSHMQSHAVTCKGQGADVSCPPPHAHTPPILDQSAHVVIRLAVMFWAWEGGEVGLAVGVGAHDRGTMRCGAFENQHPIQPPSRTCRFQCRCTGPCPSYTALGHRTG